LGSKTGEGGGFPFFLELGDLLFGKPGRLGYLLNRYTKFLAVSSYFQRLFLHGFLFGVDNFAL
jgi:hypothetical protein